MTGSCEVGLDTPSFIPVSEKIPPDRQFYKECLRISVTGVSLKKTYNII